MKIHNIEQKTDEWFKIRSCKLTASHAQEIGNCGKGLDSYILQIMSEYFSTAEKENYTNENIERGNELEEYARNMYELENDLNVEEVGFVEYNEFVGCSPDGIVGEEGLIEIKCVKDKNHFKIMLDKKIESKYLWQMQMQLLICGKKWCDYVSYNPNFEKSLVIIRVTPDEEKQKKLLDGFKIGESKIKEIINNLI